MAMLWIRKFVPSGLAGRLLLAILLALVISQIALAIILQERKNYLVRDVIERQALMQATTAAQILLLNPQVDGNSILKAFNSSSACGSIVDDPPDLGVPNAGEREFSGMLRERLGNATGAAPMARIERTNLDSPDFICKALLSAKPLLLQGRPLQVTSYVPLANKKWLSITSEIQFPDPDNWEIAAIFAVAALMVGLTAVFVVRSQTRSLDTLAKASDKFGRGEAVAILLDDGPKEVTSAIRAFNTMQSRLKTYMDDRLKMLAAISHDLRTPLTAMRLKAEFIREKATKQSLINSIDEMTLITEATLAFTKSEATHEETETSDVVELLLDLQREYVETGLKVGIDVKHHCICRARPIALKRAFRNLIDNALRYGGSADWVADRDHQHAVLTLLDSGPGIPDDQLQRVFEAFVRLEESRNKDTGGIGLGLAITRGIIQSHGGTIELSNRPEVGLAVTVRLPLASI